MDMQKFRNVGTPKGNGNNQLFLSVPASQKHDLHSVKFFSDADGERWLFEKSAFSSLMHLVEY